MELNLSDQNLPVVRRKLGRKTRKNGEEITEKSKTTTSEDGHHLEERTLARGAAMSAGRSSTVVVWVALLRAHA